VQTIPMLGHSMQAVAIPKGGEVVYDFETSPNPSKGGEQGSSPSGRLGEVTNLWRLHLTVLPPHN
jgi:hypothetical protein